MTNKAEHRRILAWIVSRIASRQSVAEDKVDVTAPLNRLGFDSMATRALTTDLEAMLGRTLAATHFWDHPSIDAAASALVQMADVVSETPSQAAGTRRTATAQAAPVSNEPIAVVGMACRFPQAAGKQAYWDLLIGGRDAITEVPPERFNWQAYFSEDVAAPGKMTTKWGGYTQDVDKFDPTFFGISPREAAQMDPQQRLMLELTWEALQDAGVPAYGLKNSATGVFVGAIWSDYNLARLQAHSVATQHTATGTHFSIIANRVSYTLGLQGPSLAVDTACSSSLVAIHLACASLRSGESNLALSGGVNLMLTPESTVEMTKFGAMCPDGRCKAFDARANGYVRGEGGGLVVLKRLSDAVRDGDTIYCVIRGSAVNNDGPSNGLSAPNPDAQRAVLRDAYRKAGIPARQVGYIECHGTGTLLGDPLEAGAIGAEVGVGRGPGEAVRIGSVKSNFGHLEAAAGVAGLIKAALALHHRTLPPSLHFQTPNPNIPFARLGIAVQKKLEPWNTPQGQARVAGVSSFGFGGTNAHVVLEEFTPQRKPYTAKREAVRAPNEDGEVTSEDSPPAEGTPVVFVYPGQGSQWNGMGRALMATHRVFRDTFKACDAALQRAGHTGVMPALLHGEDFERTDVIQPLLFALQVSLSALWKSWGVKPTAVIGHSMGEVAAAYVAGALTLDDAACVIVVRSAAVQASAGGQGGMAVVELSTEALAPMLEATQGAVVVAAINSPTTTVLAGDAMALRTLVNQLVSTGAFGQVLQVGYASHSPAMDPLLGELREHFAQIKPRPEVVSFLSCVTGDAAPGLSLDGVYWARNLRSPVRFADAIRVAHARHPDAVFVELSAHPGLLQSIDRTLPGASRNVPSMRRQEDERGTLLKSLASLQNFGCRIDVDAVNGSSTRDVGAALFTLSAHNADALRALVKQHAEEPSSHAVADLAYAQGAHMSHLAHRVAVVASNQSELEDRLREVLSGGTPAGVAQGTCQPGVRPKIGFVFSGHGAQWLGMGRALMESEPVFRETVEGCNRILQPMLGVSVLDVLRGAPGAPDADTMYIAQPSSFSVQVGLVHLWRHWGLTPDAVVGHSMGEAAAAYCAGILTLEQAAWVIRQRSHLMQRVSGRGFVVTCEMTVDEAREYIKPYAPAISVGGRNSYRTTLLTGDGDVLKRVMRELEERGIYNRAVKIPVATHSAHLDELRHELVESLHAVRPSSATVPFYSSVTGALTDWSEVQPWFWGRNLREEVWFADALSAMLADGFTQFVEISAHPILRTSVVELCKDRGIKGNVHTSLHNKQRARHTLLGSVGALYCAGFTPVWSAVSHPSSERVPLPAYPWQRERYWFKEGDVSATQSAVAINSLHPLLHVPAALSHGDDGNAMTWAWETQVSKVTHPELVDHVVQGDVVVPAAAFFDMAMAACDFVTDKTCTLTDTRLERALRLSDKSVRVQLVVTPRDDGTFEVRISSAPVSDDRPKWSVHMRGTVRPSTTTLEPLDEAAIIRMQGAMTVRPRGTFYQDTHTRGLQYGPGYQCVAEIWRNDGAALLRIDDAPKSRSGYTVQPGVLDAVLQSFFATLPHDATGLYLPVGVHELTWMRAKQSVRWVHTQLDADDSQRCTIMAYGAEHKPLLRLRGMSFQSLERPASHGAAYATRWTRAAIEPVNVRAQHFGVLTHDGRLPSTLQAALSTDGHRATALANTEAVGSTRPDAVIWVLSTSHAKPTDDPRTAEHALRTALALVRQGVRIYLVTQGAVAVANEAVDPVQTAVRAFLQGIEAEYPDVLGSIVDTDPATHMNEATWRWTYAAPESDIAVRHDGVYTPRLEHVPSVQAGPLRCHGDATYLITGGLGALGLTIAERLIKRGARRLILMGRNGLPARNTWRHIDPASTLAPAVRRIEALERLGATIRVEAADVGDANALARCMGDWQRDLPPLRGVVHAAGTMRSLLLKDVDDESLHALVWPKIYGTHNLLANLNLAELDFFALFGSITAVLGQLGLAVYGAANAYLDGVALRHRGPRSPVVSLQWGRWGTGGMSANDRARRALSAEGIEPLDETQALAEFERAFGQGHPVRMVARFSQPRMRNAFNAAHPRSTLLQALAKETTEPRPAPAAVTTLVQPTTSTPSMQSVMPTTAATPVPTGDLVERVRRCVGKVLQLDAARIDDKASLNGLGLDSIMASELRALVETDLGVKLSVASLIQGATVADLVAQVRDKLGGATAVVPAPQAPIPETLQSPDIVDAQHRYDAFPLNDIQYAYWIGRQDVYAWGNLATHVCLGFDGALEPKRLDAAWTKVVLQHDMLRANILVSGEQQIMPTPPSFHIDVRDLRSLSPAGQKSQVNTIAEQMSGSIRTAGWPHFEVVLCLLADEKTRLFLNLDMMFADLFSTGLILRDLGAFYANESLQPKPTALSYRDYLLAERKVEETSREGQQSLAYWLARLDSLPAAPQLPMHPMPQPEALKRPHITRHVGSLEPAAWDKLKARAKQAGLSPSSLMCAVLAETLSRWSQSPRFTLNVTQFRRFPLHKQVNDVVGDFTSTVLLAVDWGQDQTFTQRAKRLSEQLWTDMEHAHIGGVRVLRELAKVRREAPTMPIVFTSGLHDIGADSAWSGDLSFVGGETSQVCLDNWIQENNGKLVYSWFVADKWFPDGLADEMFAAYKGAVEGLAGRDEKVWQVGVAERLAEREWKRVEAYNDTRGPRSEKLLHELGLTHLHARPSHPAVITPERTLSYEDVFRRAETIAFALTEQKLPAAAPVAVMAEPGWEQVVGVLGVMFAGGAYVPLDPTMPPQRLAMIMENAGIKHALCSSRVDERVQWPAGVMRLRVDEQAMGNLDRLKTPGSTKPESLAYIIFTSGSTGTPKGVMIDHRGAVNTCLDLIERHHIKPNDRALAISSLGFDLSVFDIFGMFAAGGTIVYAGADAQRDPQAWLTMVTTHQVTLWNSVPALATMLVDYAKVSNVSLASLRLLYMSGDWIPLDLPAKVRAANANIEQVSMGGATEASIWSILYPIGEVKAHWRSIPYGKPMRNQRFYVLNHLLEPCPMWVPGDLYIGGVGLAMGYFKDKARTDEAFVTHPKTGERLYRTGDLGRFVSDGNIEFMGRKDSQVKIRGFRVEIGEIEHHMLQHPEIGSAYVLIRRDREEVAERTSAAASPFEAADRSPPQGRAENIFLVAYYVPKPGCDVKAGDVRDYLKDHLPHYMVPAQFIQLERIPLSANGKVDRRALPNPDFSATPGAAAVVEPRNDTERMVAGLWSELLSMPVTSVSVQTNFFDLGGNSLLLVKLATRLTSELERPIKLIELFRHTTVEAQAALIDTPADAAPDSQNRARKRADRIKQRRAKSDEGAS